MKYLNADWLYSFKKLSETGNFITASNELNITPQTLSYHIRELENYFDLKFIERGNKNNNLTENGKFFLSKINLFINDLEDSIFTVKEFKNKSINILQSTDCNFDYCLSDAIIDLHKKNKRLKIHIKSILFFEIEKYLANNDIDLIISSSPIKNDNFKTINISKIPYIIAKKNINKSIENIKYILSEYHSIRLNINNSFDFINDELEYSMSVSSSSVAISMAKKDLGAVYLPILDIEREIINNQLDFVLPNENYFFEVYVSFHKNSFKKSTINEFIDILSKCIDKSLNNLLNN